jgi:lipid-A-disaccharide synthase-like uncharacterized protein
MSYLLICMDPTPILAATFLGFEISPFELNAWKVVGLSGSVVFSLRFIIQGIASERAKQSVIPFGFWECSVLGCLLSLSYFAIYRKDSVGILQNLIPLPIYLRNLYFRYKAKAKLVETTKDPV